MTTTTTTPAKKRTTRTTPVKSAVKVAAKAAVKGAAKPVVSKTAAAPLAKTPPLKAHVAMDKDKALKEKKVKVMRDSFTIPKAEFNQIADLKKRAVMMGVDIKKSELIRAGLLVIHGLSDASFKKALAAVPAIKTGRPSKD